MNRGGTPGHGLRHEGAPYQWHAGDLYRVNPTGTGGVGIGVCSCGELSPILSTAAARKQWHREHKAQARARANVRRLGTTGRVDPTHAVR